eukprot:scaffold3127_cov156-Isochrysis_galbana.AAC.1
MTKAWVHLHPHPMQGGCGGAGEVPGAPPPPLPTSSTPEALQAIRREMMGLEYAANKPEAEKANAERRGRLQYDLNRAERLSRRELEHVKSPQSPRGLRRWHLILWSFERRPPSGVQSFPFPPPARCGVGRALGRGACGSRCQGAGALLVDAAIDFYLERRGGHHVHPPIITLECGSFGGDTSDDDIGEVAAATAR